MFMETALRVESEFQVVIMSGFGSSLYPLVQDSLPKGLLPIANKPMLFYALKWIEKANYKDIIICCYPEAKQQISSYVHEVYDVGLNIKVHEVPENCGSADALRHLAKDIKNDFIVYSVDLITDVPAHVLINSHYALNSTVTAFFYDATKIETPEMLKSNGEIIGIHDKTSQLLYTCAKEDLKAGQNQISIKHSLLSSFSNLRLNSNLRDGHLYIFQRWVLDLIVKNTFIGSIKSDLMPLLIDLQHRKSLRLRYDIKTLQEFHTPDLFAQARSLSLSSYHVPQVLCTAIVWNDGLSARANNIKTYSELNRTIAKKDPKPPTNCNINAKATVGTDCLIGDGCVIDERCSIKKSVVGNHVTIGKNCKISNSIVMDYAVIEDGVKLDSCVLCPGSKVCIKSELKECEVAGGNVVAPETKSKGSQFLKPMNDD